MINRFAAKKDWSFALFLIIVTLFILFIGCVMPVFTNDNYTVKDSIIPGLIFIPVIGLFLWIWIGTYYLIDNEILILRSGPLVFKVPVRNITKIQLNQLTVGGMWRLTLSWRSIEVIYSKYDSVFITPERQEEFLTELLKINKEIKIK